MDSVEERQRLIDHGKRNVLGVLIDAVDYDVAVHRIVQAARASEAFGVTALAVHGVMSGVLDRVHRYRLNHLDLVVPDGQPVRWGLNALYGCGLTDRVYGPELTLRVCAAAASEGIPVYFYGSSADVLRRAVANLEERFPGLSVAGSQPSRFRSTNERERQQIVDGIRSSGAKIAFVGLGCPRQEVWAYEYRASLGMPIVAVGAAFDFHAGTLAQAPPALQRMGLEWAFRLVQEPTRLWRRYLYLNPTYLTLLGLQRLHLWRPDCSGRPPVGEVGFG